MGFLTDNAMKHYSGEEKDVIIDLGYIDKDGLADERYQKLRKYGIGKENFNVELSGRLVVRPPKSKIDGIMKTFPIREGGRYWMTTHSWEEQTDGIPER